VEDAICVKCVPYVCVYIIRTIVTDLGELMVLKSLNAMLWIMNSQGSFTPDATRCGASKHFIRCIRTFSFSRATLLPCVTKRHDHRRFKYVIILTP